MVDVTPPVAHDVALPLVTSWEEWGRIFTDVPVWTPAVREIGRRAGLPVTTLEAGYPGTNAVFIVNGGTGQPYVVKIYCPFCHEDVTLERVLHPLLAQCPGLPVPVLLGQGVLTGALDWPYLILSFLPGSAIRDVRAQVSQTNLVAIAHDLGRYVRALHSIPHSDLSPLLTVLGDWGAVAGEQLAGTCDYLTRKETLPPTLIAQVPDYVAPVLESQNSADLVLVNGDLTEDHVLLQEQDGEWHISGLIDFADSLIGPRDYEWVALWFGALARDPACLRAFMQGYEPGFVLDAVFRRRAMAFSFLHEFGGPTIEMALNQLGNPRIESLVELESLLWPLSLTTGGMR